MRPKPRGAWKDYESARAKAEAMGIEYDLAIGAEERLCRLEQTEAEAAKLPIDKGEVQP